LQDQPLRMMPLQMLMNLMMNILKVLDAAAITTAEKIPKRFFNVIS